MLPDSCKEKIEVNPTSSLTELQEFANWLYKSQNQDSKGKEDTLQAASSSIELDPQTLVDNDDPEVTKEAFERANRTIQNALQSLLSLDQKESDETTEDGKSTCNFGEI